MRVIAGEKRHLILKTLSDLSIRPTTDKIKETLFNMLHFSLPNTNFLDLFAGSGAIGIEALSRGAKFCTFVDNNDKAINVIKENLTHTKLLDKAKVVRANADSFVLNNNSNIKYDIVFMDPPYDKGLYEPVFVALKNSPIIDNNTLIILETSLRDDALNIIDLGFEQVKIKKYKSNKHIFFKKIK